MTQLSLFLSLLILTSYLQPIKATPCNPKIEVITGSFYNWIMDQNYSRRDDRAYQKSSPADLAIFSNTVTQMINGNICNAKILAKKGKMVVQKMIDSDLIHPKRTPYYCISGAKKNSNRYNSNRYRGLYCIKDNTGSNRLSKNLHIAVPHPKYDRNTNLEGAKVFQETDARYFSLATTHRRSNRQKSTCQHHHRVSDMAHNTKTFFQIFAAKVHDLDQNSYHIQLHGYTKAYQNDIAIISNGTKQNLKRNKISRIFTTYLKKKLKSNQQILNCNDPKDDGQQTLCATTNIQGRYINGLTKNPCRKNSGSIHPNRFLHIEQTEWIRGKNITEPDYVDYIAPKYQLISTALTETFSSIKKIKYTNN